MRSDRPYVICHMLPSLDGRIVIRDWKLENAAREYEKTAATFRADAWIIGRISMEPYAGKARVPSRKTTIAREDFVAPHDASSYAIAVDPSGKLRWERSDIDGEHVITILTLADAYLAFLQETGVSYLFGGKSRISIPRILRRLRGGRRQRGHPDALRRRQALACANAHSALDGKACRRHRLAALQGPSLMVVSLDLL